MADPVQLPYTIQTHIGMVQDFGRPALRRLPHQRDLLPYLSRLGLWGSKKPIKVHRINNSRDYAKYDEALCHTIAEKAIRLICSGKTPRSNCLKPSTNSEKFKANISACQSRVSKGHLVEYVRRRACMDVEQAAAAVISAFINDGRMDDAMTLLKELGGALATSCMWLQRDDLPSRHRTPSVMLANLGDKLQSCFANINTPIEKPRTYAQMVPLLLQIRKAGEPKQRLYIPLHMFEEARIEPPRHRDVPLSGHITEGKPSRSRENVTTGFYPTKTPSSKYIDVSPSKFGYLQRHIFELFVRRDPKSSLSLGIRRLEEQAQYEANWVEETLRETQDVAMVALWFFHFQRRLQKAVVGGVDSTRLLSQGEGSSLYQNNLSIRSTFEIALARIAGQKDGPLSISPRTLELIERACLLMKKYVDVYGNGKKENLVFQPDQPEDEDNRGPTEDYNRLCDVLEVLIKAAKNEGIEDVPGPVSKFLPKDIVKRKFTSKWKDDAFAEGKIPGWESWLRLRQVREDSEDGNGDVEQNSA